MDNQPYFSHGLSDLFGLNHLNDGSELCISPKQQQERASLILQKDGCIPGEKLSFLLTELSIICKIFRETSMLHLPSELTGDYLCDWLSTNSLSLSTLREAYFSGCIPFSNLIVNFLNQSNLEAAIRRGGAFIQDTPVMQTALFYALNEDDGVHCNLIWHLLENRMDKYTNYCLDIEENGQIFRVFASELTLKIPQNVIEENGRVNIRIIALTVENFPNYYQLGWVMFLSHLSSHALPSQYNGYLDNVSTIRNIMSPVSTPLTYYDNMHDMGKDHPVEMPNSGMLSSPICNHSNSSHIFSSARPSSPTFSLIKPSFKNASTHHIRNRRSKPLDVFRNNEISNTFENMDNFVLAVMDDKEENVLESQVESQPITCTFLQLDGTVYDSLMQSDGSLVTHNPPTLYGRIACDQDMQYNIESYDDGVDSHIFFRPNRETTSDAHITTAAVPLHFDQDENSSLLDPIFDPFELYKFADTPERDISYDGEAVCYESSDKPLYSHEDPLVLAAYPFSQNENDRVVSISAHHSSGGSSVADKQELMNWIEPNHWKSTALSDGSDGISKEISFNDAKSDESTNILSSSVSISSVALEENFLQCSSCSSDDGGVAYEKLDIMSEKDELQESSEKDNVDVFVAEAGLNHVGVFWDTHPHVRTIGWFSAENGLYNRRFVVRTDFDRREDKKEEDPEGLKAFGAARLYSHHLLNSKEARTFAWRGLKKVLSPKSRYENTAKWMKQMRSESLLPADTLLPVASHSSYVSLLKPMDEPKEVVEAAIPSVGAEPTPNSLTSAEPLLPCGDAEEKKRIGRPLKSGNYTTSTIHTGIYECAIQGRLYIRAMWTDPTTRSRCQKYFKQEHHGREHAILLAKECRELGLRCKRRKYEVEDSVQHALPLSQYGNGKLTDADTKPQCPSKGEFKMASLYASDVVGAAFGSTPNSSESVGRHTGNREPIGKESAFVSFVEDTPLKKSPPYVMNYPSESDGRMMGGFQRSYRGIEASTLMDRFSKGEHPPAEESNGINWTPQDTALHFASAPCQSSGQPFVNSAPCDWKEDNGESDFRYTAKYAVSVTTPRRPTYLCASSTFNTSNDSFQSNDIEEAAACEEASASPHTTRTSPPRMYPVIMCTRRYWRVEWISTETGKRVYKHFGENRYGVEQSKQVAQEFFQDLILQLSKSEADRLKGGSSSSSGSGCKVARNSTNGSSSVSSSSTTASITGSYHSIKKQHERVKWLNHSSTFSSDLNGINKQTDFPLTHLSKALVSASTLGGKSDDLLDRLNTVTGEAFCCEAPNTAVNSVPKDILWSPSLNGWVVKWIEAGIVKSQEFLVDAYGMQNAEQTAVDFFASLNEGQEEGIEAASGAAFQEHRDASVSSLVKSGYFGHPTADLNVSRDLFSKMAEAVSPKLTQKPYSSPVPSQSLSATEEASMSPGRLESLETATGNSNSSNDCSDRLMRVGENSMHFTGSHTWSGEDNSPNSKHAGDSNHLRPGQRVPGRIYMLTIRNVRCWRAEWYDKFSGKRMTRQFAETVHGSECARLKALQVLVKCDCVPDNLLEEAKLTFGYERQVQLSNASSKPGNPLLGAFPLIEAASNSPNAVDAAVSSSLPSVTSVKSENLSMNGGTSSAMGIPMESQYRETSVYGREVSEGVQQCPQHCLPDPALHSIEFSVVSPGSESENNVYIVAGNRQPNCWSTSWYGSNESRRLPEDLYSANSEKFANFSPFPIQDNRENGPTYVAPTFNTAQLTVYPSTPSSPNTLCKSEYYVSDGNMKTLSTNSDPLYLPLRELPPKIELPRLKFDYHALCASHSVPAVQSAAAHLYNLSSNSFLE